MTASSTPADLGSTPTDIQLSIFELLDIGSLSKLLRTNRSIASAVRAVGHKHAYLGGDDSNSQIPTCRYIKDIDQKAAFQSLTVHCAKDKPNACNCCTRSTIDNTAGSSTLHTEIAEPIQSCIDRGTFKRCLFVCGDAQMDVPESCALYEMSAGVSTWIVSQLADGTPAACKYRAPSARSGVAPSPASPVSTATSAKRSFVVTQIVPHTDCDTQREDREQVAMTMVKNVLRDSSGRGDECILIVPAGSGQETDDTSLLRQNEALVAIFAEEFANERESRMNQMMTGPERRQLRESIRDRLKVQSGSWASTSAVLQRLYPAVSECLGAPNLPALRI